MESQQRGKFRHREFSGSANDGAGFARRPARPARPVRLPGCPREHSRLMKSTMAFVCTVAGVGARIALRPTRGRGVSKVWCSPAQFCIIPLCRQPVKDDRGELEKRKGIGTGWERCTKERTEGSTMSNPNRLMNATRQLLNYC